MSQDDERQPTFLGMESDGSNKVPEEFYTPLRNSVTPSRKGSRKEILHESLTATPTTTKNARTPVAQVAMDLSEQDMRKEINRQDELIREQASLIKKLRDDLNCKMSESVIIETNNKICSQESRIHNRDVELLQQDLEKSKKRLRKLNDEIVFEQGRNVTLKRDLEKKQEKIGELEEEVKLVKEEIDAHKKKEIEWNRHESQLKSDITAIDMDSRTAIAKLEAKLNKAKETISDLRTKLEECEKQMQFYKKGLNEAKEDERRRSDELRQKEGQIAKKETELQIRRSLDVNFASFNRNLESSLLSTLSTHIFNIQPQYQAIDLVQFGSLTTANEFLNKQVKELKEKEEKLMEQLEEAQHESTSAKVDLENLEKKLVEIEGNAEMTHKYLLDENTKVKQAKADMRCELMELKREHGKVQEQVKQFEENQVDKTELNLLKEKFERSEKTRAELEKNKENAEQELRVVQLKVKELEETLVSHREDLDSLSSLKIENSSLQGRVKTVENKNSQMQRALTDLDEQCAQLMKLKKRGDDWRKKAQDEIAQLSAQLRSREREIEGVKRTEAEMEVLRADNDRLETKIHYLNEELRETHTDYREELSRLARQISENRAQKTERTDEEIKKLEELKESKIQLDSMLRACKRQVEELKQDNEKLTSQITEVRERDRETNEENAKLRQGLGDAVTKCEKYKIEASEAVEKAQIAEENLKRITLKQRKLEVELSDLDEVIREKERLIGYLQGQTNAQKMPKLKAKPTLLYHPSSSSLDSQNDHVDAEEIMELENEKRRLKESLERKKQELNTRKGSAEFITPGRPRVIPTAPPRTPLSLVQSAPSIASPMSGSQMSQSSKKAAAIGTMRHDIPHRWKSQLGFGVRQIKCAVCFEPVPRISYAMRCMECDVVVHKNCSNRVQNTCGMPTQCASFYHDNSRLMSSNMNGWVKVYKSVDPHRQWRSAWAKMDEKKLAFFDSDGLAEQQARSFLGVNLETTTFTVRALGEGPSGESDGFANCVQLKMNGGSIYMLCPSVETKARWTNALQSASARRHMLTRKPSSFSGVSLTLALDAPHNLSINCIVIVDDWLLIGAQEGLFATSYSTPRVPFSLPGVGAVHALEAMLDLGILACVIGPSRHLSLISISQLRMELSGRQPAVRPQPIPGFEYVHLLTYHKDGQHRYLLAADTNKIHILQYKRDIFAPFVAIETTEPATCLLSAHGGIYYGADSFYYASLHGGNLSVNGLAPSHVADYPLAVLEVGPNEVLLAYQNYGTFVNCRGEKSRNASIEWEQTPMEFVYTAPYLYVVHFDSLEIMQVYDNTGKDSKTVSDEREVYRSEQAHLVGRRDNGDVFVALSNNQRVELHAFNAQSQKRSGAKRKGLIGAFPSMGTLDKRSKTNIAL